MQNWKKIIIWKIKQFEYSDANVSLPKARGYMKAPKEAGNLKLYNTLTNKKEEFVPIEPGNVKIYACGPTVYNYIHLGNARPYVVFDALRRYFEYKGYNVTMVQNFTDVDDRIIKIANDENTDMKTISDRYIKEYFHDADGLNVKRATVHPKATEEIDGIIEMVKTLIEKGYAYEVNGSVYFETSKFKEYYKLSKRDPDKMEAGKRIEINEEKRNPMDFILWKPAKEGEPSWESPWGNGRPGWHIECSTMARKYLGDTIDIHAGGEDLVFPHHENEIAQSEAVTGKPFAKFWIHNSMISIDNKKMSKSKGNFFTVREIAEKYPYELVRFFLLGNHYRMPLNFSEDLLVACGNSFNRLRNCYQELHYKLENNEQENMLENEKDLVAESEKYFDMYIESLDDDFNTPNAITAIFELVKYINTNVSENSSKEVIKVFIDKLDKMFDILGLKLEMADETTAEVRACDIEALLEKRETARKEKNWQLADEIRDELIEKGVEIKDTPEGVKWFYKGCM